MNLINLVLYLMALCVLWIGTETVRTGGENQCAWTTITTATFVKCGKYPTGFT